jgi:hypothetical protein
LPRAGAAGTIFSSKLIHSGLRTARRTALMRMVAAINRLRRRGSASFAVSLAIGA